MTREHRLREVPELKRSFELHGARGPDSAGNWALRCPFCVLRVNRVDEEYKMTVRVSGELPAREPDRPEPVPLTPERAVYNCYRCNARGFADFRWLAEAAPHVALPAAPQADVDLGPPEAFVPVGQCERSISMRWAPEYFARRGVLEAARAVGAGACHRGRYGGRVVVPHVADQKGPWLGFSARLVRGDGPKYLYPRGMDRRHALWGAAWLPDDRSVPAYVVEGVFDGLPLFPRAVAPLGKAVTPEQIDLMVALGRPLVPCLDGDAWEECRALATLLRMRGVDVPAWAHLPPGTDPGSLGEAVSAHLVT